MSVIYQELNLAEQVSVAENIFAGREFVNRFGLIDYKTLYKNAGKWLDELQIKNVDPRDEVRQLSIARKQMVEIAKALSLDSSIIVMDEPTSSLPTATTNPNEVNEVQVLLSTIRKLRDRGKAVIYISHRMEEIFRISDRITVPEALDFAALAAEVLQLYRDLKSGVVLAAAIDPALPAVSEGILHVVRDSLHVVTGSLPPGFGSDWAGSPPGFEPSPPVGLGHEPGALTMPMSSP